MAGRGACAEQQQVRGLPANHMLFTCFLAATGSCQAMQEARVEPVLQQVLPDQDR